MPTGEKMAHIEPQRFGLNDQFRFKCHKDVKCWTKCCRGIKIVLTPYDIYMLKNRLQLSSEEFLAIYTEPHLLEKTDLPVVTLKMLDDEQQSCPFVREDGCLVYKDRPTTCRYYPLGVASLSHKEDADGENFFFFVNEPHCLGFEEDADWTVSDWRKDQGVDIHDEINAGWTDLVVRKRSFPPNIKLTEESKQMFFMVSYNFDKFKRFIFESSFLDRYDIPEERIARMKEDDFELLKFGSYCLKFIFYKIGEFQLKNTAQKTDS
jgi:Fe-S-cluster containining protein